MKKRNTESIAIACILLLISIPSFAEGSDEVVRPEEIKSKRLVIYDDDAYVKLADLWRDYCDAYPSEYAYANWMYAARYANDDNYWALLNKGLKIYPWNPTLLYLKSMERRGAHDDDEGRKYLEKAISIDPRFTDAWFSLVTIYMDSGQEEQLDLALRRLLESGVIADEVMDYNYNMLIGLDDNAIVITNGDNDTYPGWILTRILKVRPDVAIVNRSLLNTPWYPSYMIGQGLPRFIGEKELDDLRDSILREIKEKKKTMPAAGPFGDTLITKIIEAADRAGRPVYISRTVYLTEMVNRITENGRDLGLVTIVTKSNNAYSDQLRKAYGKWIDGFRTAGLESWRLRNAPLTDAGRMIVANYATGAAANLETLKKNAPEIRLPLFRWYREHIEKLISEEKRTKIAYEWCRFGSDIKEIDDWSGSQGIKCQEPAGR